MPELPDLTLYLDALARVARGRRIEALRIESPFVLRSVAPAPGELAGRRIVGERRLGKRIVLELEDATFVVVHLMIAGRLLADRTLSRLLHDDWPRTLDELEARRAPGRTDAG